MTAMIPQDVMTGTEIAGPGGFPEQDAWYDAICDDCGHPGRDHDDGRCPAIAYVTVALSSMEHEPDNRRTPQDCRVPCGCCHGLSYVYLTGDPADASDACPACTKE